MRATTPSIFLSYARSDGRSLAHGLRTELEATGLDLWQDVVDMEAGERWWSQVTEAIDNSAVMVLVLTEAALSSAVVRDEWSYARTVGTHVIPVVGDATMLAKAPKWTRKLDVVILDPGHGDYALSKERFLRQLRDPPPRRPHPFSAPNLPRTFVQRTAEFGQLLSHLLDARRENPVAITVALHGSSGFGKTTLALALCHDERIRVAFDGGVLWIQFGQHLTKADALALLDAQIRLLDPAAQIHGEITQAAARFRELTADRDMLIVLDDMWSETYLSHFIHEGATYVITTRLQPIATLPGSVRVPVDELLPDESMDLLCRPLGRMPDADDRRVLGELARRLGNWALLLELVGGELRSLMSSGRSLRAAAGHVTQRLDRRGFTYLDREDGDNRNAAIAQSLEASLTSLPERQRGRFYELAILVGDTGVPFATIEQLWASSAGFDDLEAEDALEAMHRLALFSRYDARQRTLRLHDVVRDVIAAKLTDAGRLHRGLIEHWKDLSHLPDTYAWKHALHHLRGAGRAGEIPRLLFDFNWIQAKLRATDPASLIGDYVSESPRPGCELMASVLTMAGAALADETQLASQLIGRLSRLADRGGPVQSLLDGAAREQAEPALLPLKVDLPSVDQGLHTTLICGAVVLSGALAEDGSALIVGLADGTVQVWDWRRLHQVRVLKCGVGPVYSIAVQKELLAVGGFDEHPQTRPYDAVAQVWNWTSGELIRSTGSGVEDAREGYATTLRDQWLAITTGAMNNHVHVFDWVSDTLVTLIRGDEAESHGNRPDTAAFAGSYLLYHTRSSRRIDLWTIGGFEYRGMAGGQVGDDAVPFAIHDRLFVRSRWTQRPEDVEGFFYRRDDEDTTAELNVWSYDEPVSAVAHTRDRLFTCSYFVDVRAIDSGELLGRLEGHSGPIVCVHPLDDVILTAAHDGTIRIWDRRQVETAIAHRQTRAPAIGATPFYQPPISTIALEGGSAFVGTTEGILEEWDWRTVSPGIRLPLNAGVRALAANDAWVVFSWFDRIKEGRLRAAPRPDWSRKHEAGEVTRTDEFTIYNGVVDFGDRGVVMAKLCDESCAILLRDHYTPANSIGFGDYTGDKIFVIDLSTMETEFVGGEWASAVALSPRFIVAGTVQGHVDIWSRGSGAAVRRLNVHQKVVTGVALQEEFLLSSSVDRTVQVWSLVTCDPVRTIPHSGTVNALHVRGNVLVTASDDHVLRVFNWRTGVELARFTDDASLDACGIAEDMATIVCGGKSGRLHVLRANAALAARLTD